MKHITSQLKDRSSSLSGVDHLIKRKMAENDFSLNDYFVIEVEITGGMFGLSGNSWSVAKPSYNIQDIASVVQCIRDFLPRIKIKLKFVPNKVKIMLAVDASILDPFTLINFTNILVVGMTPAFDQSKVVISEVVC